MLQTHPWSPLPLAPFPSTSCPLCLAPCQLLNTSGCFMSKHSHHRHLPLGLAPAHLLNNAPWTVSQITAAFPPQVAVLLCPLYLKGTGLSYLPDALKSSACVHKAGEISVPSTDKGSDIWESGVPSGLLPGPKLLALCLDDVNPWFPLMSSHAP
jgi:hypothetical protein